MNKRHFVLKECENKIKQLILEKQDEFKRMEWGDYNVVGAVLYGSRVRSDYRKDSDLDISPLTRDGKYTDVDNFLTKISNIARVHIDSMGFNDKYDSFTPENAVWYIAWKEHRHPYRIVSPYTEIKKKVKEIISNCERPIKNI